MQDQRVRAGDVRREQLVRARRGLPQEDELLAVARHVGVAVAARAGAGAVLAGLPAALLDDWDRARIRFAVVRGDLVSCLLDPDLCLFHRIDRMVAYASNTTGMVAAPAALQPAPS